MRTAIRLTFVFQAFHLCLSDATKILFIPAMISDSHKIAQAQWANDLLSFSTLPDLTVYWWSPAPKLDHYQPNRALFNDSILKIYHYKVSQHGNSHFQVLDDLFLHNNSTEIGEIIWTFRFGVPFVEARTTYMVTSYCSNIIDPNNKPIDKYFRELSNINFDLIIIDELFNPCGYLLINLLRNKFPDKPPPVSVYSSTCKQTRMSMSLNNLPIPYSHVPHMGSMSILTDKLTFWQRVQTLISYLIGYLGDWVYYYAMQRNLVGRFYPDLTEISLRSSMAQPVFQFYCIPKFFDLPQPLAPNHFYMGGLQLNFKFDSATNSNDIMEPDLEAKISKNEKGFVLVALGHWADFEYCTAEIRNEFGRALNHAAGLGYLIVWKYVGPKVENAHKNVHFANWLPQRQLLAHPKCKLLITHGGCNSVTEAIFNGVPVVVTPLFADQGDAAARIITKNLGVAVQKSRLGSKDVVKNAILEVLTNETIEVMGEETMSDREEVIVEKVTCSSMLRRANAFITEGVRKLLYKHGYVVGHYPLIFAISPLLITGLLTLGVLKFKADQDVRHLFTPIDAPSHVEFEKVQKYFDDEGDLYELALFFRAKDGGSVIRPRYLDRVIELTKYFNDNFTIYDQKTNRTYNFGRDLKFNHDQEYESLLEGLSAIKFAVSESNQWVNTTTLVMPTPRGDVYVGNLLSNVTRRRLNASLTVIDVQCLRIMYRSACGDAERCRLLKQWTAKFLTQDQILIDDLVSFWPWNDYLLSVELLRVSTTLIPYVIVSFLILIFFAVCASLTDSVITSKPWEALAGVTSVGLAVASSFGTIFLLNYSFVGTLAVMPVLVLAMGLDVTFIVLRNWQSTNPELDVPSRLAETWGESGTSVIITSLTNIMSTCIGMITDTPAIRTFCLSTTVAVLFLFIYQITFFAAAIAIGGRRESKNRNAFLSCLPAKPNVNSSTARKQPLEPRRSLEFPTPVHRTLSRTLSTTSNCSSKTVSKFQRQETAASNGNVSVGRGQIVAARILNDDWWYKISQKLATVLCNMYCRFVVLVILTVYWLTAVYGCLHIELGLSPEKLFLEDSAVLYSVKSDKTNILLNVFIQKPPDFTNETEEMEFLGMVEELESLPECVGPDSTSLFLRPYAEYLEFFGDRSDFYQHLRTFRQAAHYKHWLSYFETSYDNRTGYSNLTKFFFTVAYKRHLTFKDRVRYTIDFRRVISKYEQKYDAAIYCDDNNNFVVDQLLAIPANTIQDVLITGFCMAVICLLFIPNFFNTVCAMVTIFSINVGVFGYLVHWDVALDPVSMTSLLMSIGYSVDFTSHISFHYYISSGANQKEKLISALSSIGLPMIETGFSTILSVGCLCMVESYLIWVYFKTTFLVVILGLFHGLIVLPTFLAWLPMDVWEWIYGNDKQDGQMEEKSNDGGQLQRNHSNGHRPLTPSKPDIVQIAMGQRK